MDSSLPPVISLTRKLIEIPSITPLKAEDYPVAQQTLDLLEAYAREMGAKTERLPSEGNHTKWPYRVDNLYVNWTFGTPKQHLAFFGHTDVVPVGQADAWTVPPFEGVIKDGYLYGRGTTDMKGAVAAFFCAMKEEAPHLNDISISAIITTDEEWAAVNGTKHVLAWMKEKNYPLDAAIVGEPSSQDILGSHIKLGRRGSLVGRLVSKGVQGHAAYPAAFQNANRGLTLALAILQELQWDDAYSSMPATNFEPVALQSGDFKASAIIPGQAEALWNIRFTPKQTPNGLVERLQQTLQNPPAWALAHRNVDALKTIEVVGNIDTASRPYVSTESSLASLTRNAIETVTKQKTVYDCSGGTTDGRFIHQFFPDAQIIELGVPERGGLLADDQKPDDYLTCGGMHQTDERVAIRDLVNLVTIYTEILRRFG